MNHHPVSVVLLLLCFFSIIRASSDDDPAHAGGDIVSVNCGSTGTSVAVLSGREWGGDSQKKKLSSLVELKGSSTTSTVVNQKSILDPVPYKTARLSRSQFSYTFQVNPGQNVLRPHFNSGPYKGFKRYKDLFDVEAVPFTLLGNFSVSLAAEALGVSSFVKEFCMNIEENQLLNVIFSPASSQLRDTYAFVNGIEVISVPAARSYFHMEHVGVQLEGEPPVYIDNITAFEIIRRLNIRQDTVPSSIDDIGDGFGMWETVPKQKGNKVNNVTWKVSVDVGFRYLVRLHFSRMGFKFAELGGFTFEVQINQKIANTNSDRVKERDDDGGHFYRDYMVGMKGSKQEGKRDIMICLKSNDEFGEGHGPLKGFEILKLSNHDNSLASPNPLPFVNYSSYQSLRTLLNVLGHKSAIASAAMIVLVLVNMIAYELWKIQEARHTEEESMLLVKPDRLCRQFSLVEIQLATKNFNDALLIGRGGFGKVYKGIIDNGRQTVAIKRLKSNSSQGMCEFLTEIETLTELRHVNLVSLIGYCKEHNEMILVYEYMAFGTLDDHLFQCERNDENTTSLTWNQRLNICIGAGRGLEYLHTGHSIIHRDVKASNVLLDEDFTAKVSDFGLAKHLCRGKSQQSHITTKVKGTFGYFDPEYFRTGKLTRKSDTYSFGVLLLEVLSGRRAFDRGCVEDEQMLIYWAQENISKGNTDQIVAASLRGEISDESLKAFVVVAERCLHNERKERPTMAQVVAQLEVALQLQESSKSSVPNEKSNLEDMHPLYDEASSPVSPVRPKRASVVEGKEKVDAEVDSLLGKLQQLLLYHTHLIRGTKNQLEQLENDLRLFRAFLWDTTEKRLKHEFLQELIPQIHDIVYEAGDTIDAFVTYAANIKSQNYFSRAFTKPVNLRPIARHVQSISIEIKDIYNKNKFDFSSLNIGDGDPGEPAEVPQIGEDIMVDLEDEALKIIGYLCDHTCQLDVISIIGVSGLGKTTLVRKIFHDINIQYKFPTRIWVHVSQELTIKNVYLTILKEFTRITEDMRSKNDQDLAQLVYAYLKKGKFLIVMDDVWTTNDWDKIQVALPMNNNAGKVLITSRHRKVALHANQQRIPHTLRFLTQEESWLLLQHEVFGKPECPSELEVLGKQIAEQCDRLPLAIVVIGGILVKRFLVSDDTSMMKVAWEKVLHSMSSYLNEDPEQRMEKLIALSYDRLPYHLRACFLYLGMFPEGFAIPVWKLIRMWIAERFIQEEYNISLEETAENYLNELIDRKLVKVEKRRLDGRVKTCCIHDMLRDFCKYEAGSEKQNFLQEIRTCEGFQHPPVGVERYRRICIHSNVLNFISKRPFGPRVHTFVCFSKEDIVLPTENTSTIPAAFKWLRVLDVEPIKFAYFPRDIYQLVHLRYIVLSFNLTVLPAAFAKLWNIETLIVDTSKRTLEIEADIWKMRQLRHLKTNASASLHKAGKNHKEGEKLQTLGTISPQSCTKEVFDRARNLKELSIRGKLASLLDGKIVSFSSLAKLSNLQKLKLLNDVFRLQTVICIAFLPRTNSHQN